MESKDSNKLVEFADIVEVMHALVTGLKTDKTLMPCATAISLTVTLYQLWLQVTTLILHSDLNFDLI